MITTNKPFVVKDRETLTAAEIKAHVRAEMEEDAENQRLHGIVAEFMRPFDQKPLGLRFKKALGNDPELSKLDGRLSLNYGMAQLCLNDGKVERNFLLAYHNSELAPRFDFEKFLDHNPCFTTGAAKRNAARERILQGDGCAELAKLVRNAAKAVAALRAWEEAHSSSVFPDSSPYCSDKL